MSRKTVIILMLIALTAFGIHFVDLLDASAATGDELGIDLEINDISDIVTRIACWLIKTILAVMVIFLIWSGVKFFIAKGDPTKVTEAKKNFLWVVVGVIVILATNIIIATVAQALGSNYPASPFSLGCGVSTRFIVVECDDDRPCENGLDCEKNPGAEVGICVAK